MKPSERFGLAMLLLMAAFVAYTAHRIQPQRDSTPERLSELADSGGKWRYGEAATRPAADAPPQAPPLGWTTWCEILDVHDGDTVRVRVTRDIDVRLEDCWAPELKDPGGRESRSNLMTYAPIGERLYLFVPGSDRGRLSDEFTFGRVVGRLYSVGGQDLNALQVEDGHATAAKVTR